MSDDGERGLDITALGPYFLHSSVASNLFQNKGILKFKTVDFEPAYNFLRMAQCEYDI